MIERRFDWDDVGSWRAWSGCGSPTPAGNVIDAPRHVGINTDRHDRPRREARTTSWSPWA